jgi:hypothetical protein
MITTVCKPLQGSTDLADTADQDAVDSRIHMHVQPAEQKEHYAYGQLN